ncbi:hypothetical protein [Spirosoma panaciterrae]|uniref:hypothetical protein n=1 Tax=Spirosoma panaciterrae TaxID=496058 RepID=UPI001B7FB61F|nr:hypothetical protein [Spirosoma panaciterrae]
MKEQLIFNIRMQLAALRQLLRDRSSEMTEEEKNLILDQIIKLTSLLTELEKKT